MPAQVTPGRELTASPSNAPLPARVRFEFFASDDDGATVDVIYRILGEDVRVAFQGPGGPEPTHRKSGVELSGLSRPVTEDVTLVDTGATVFPVPVQVRASLVAQGAQDDGDPLDSTTTTFFAERDGG